MPNKKTYPRLFTHVLQAIAEMHESRGSTVRKIVDQVNSSINVANLRPKPRNVVVQVRKAIQYGRDAGVLKQRAGKVSLALGQDTPSASRSVSRHLRVTSRSRRRLARNKKLTEKKKESALARVKRPPVRKVKKPPSAPGAVVAKRGGRKRKRGGGKRRRQAKKRRLTPAVRKSNEEFIKGDEEDEVKTEGSKRTSFNCQELPHDHDQDQDDEPNVKIEEYPQQNCVNCDNPECICNIKQEPMLDDDEDDDADQDL